MRKLLIVGVSLMMGGCAIEPGVLTDLPGLLQLIEVIKGLIT